MQSESAMQSESTDRIRDNKNRQHFEMSLCEIKLPCDRRRFHKKISNFSTVLISKRKSKGVYKIVHDQKMFNNELSALQAMNMSSHFTKVINYDRSQQFMYIERGEVVFDMFYNMVSNMQVVPYDIACAFTSDLLSALKHLHSTELCHGDIKLENIIHMSSDGMFKLIDLGLSCPATKMKSRVGSISYLPPEGFTDGVIINGHKSDIWSSGICIFATWCSMKIPWHAANAEVDNKFTNGTHSYWKSMISQFNILEYCYKLCRYLGPSIIVSSMLKLEPSMRTPAVDLIELWNIVKR